MIREGAYRRLIDFYYASEKPLPLDVEQIYEIARCRGKLEREAIDYVVDKFFFRSHDGFRQKKCDEIISAYLEGEPEREEKKANSKERKRRSRQRRQKLFEELREHGVAPAFDATIAHLEELLSRVTKTNGHTNGHTRERLVVTPGMRDGTATHSQSPSPSPQSQDVKTPQTPQGGASRHRRSPERAERDKAKARWSALLKSGGAGRDARDQVAIDAAGGWSAISQRTERDEAALIRKFCDAYRETESA
jgi:uncharacterized protein YdaU (DUF1376 family)